MNERFKEVLARTIEHEGGFSDDRADRGNWTGGQVGVGKLKGTKYGISAMSYPDVDIRALTLEQARAIYWRDFWLAAGCELLAPPADALVFDAAVNHGVGNAVRLLQRALGVADDGQLGPISQAEAKRAAPAALAARFVSHRLLFWASLSTFDRYGRGWTRRGAQTLLAAMDELR